MTEPPRTDLIVESTRSLLEPHRDGEAIFEVADLLDRLLLARSQAGLLKYGKGLDEHPVDYAAMFRHATEEWLDAANYMMTLHAWSGRTTYRRMAEAAIQLALVTESDRTIFNETGRLPDD